MNYFKLATNRKSTRSFKDKAVGVNTIAHIGEYFANCKKLIPEIDVEMKIIDPKYSPQMTGCVGYEDYLIKSPAYLLLISEKSDNALINAGYIGEDMVLKLTDLGLSTCWVTINDDKKLKERLKIEGDKYPVALIAFGYEDKEHAVRRLDIKNISNVILKKRSSYEAPKLFIDDAIFSEDIGIKAEHSVLDSYTDLHKALISACCAPSFLNKQPYRFIIKGGLFVLVALEDKDTSENDFFLNLGIVMLNLYGALSERSGVYGKWELTLSDSVKSLELPEGGKAVAQIHI